MEMAKMIQLSFEFIVDEWVSGLSAYPGRYLLRWSLICSRVVNMYDIGGYIRIFGVWL
jgi:hypothetical protein